MILVKSHTHGVQRLLLLTAILSTETGINLYSVVVCQYILDNFVITVNISKAFKSTRDLFITLLGTGDTNAVN